MFARAAGVMADAGKTSLQRERRKSDELHLGLEREWRNEDLQHRKLETSWRRIENKRRRVEEKLTQVGLLARLSALMGGFQVAVFVNQGVPDVITTWPYPNNETSVWQDSSELNHPVMTLWAVTCVLSVVTNICVMLMASLMQLSIIKSTSDEGEGSVPKAAQYSLDNPDGIIVEADQFIDFWFHRFDGRFRNLTRAFSYGVPIYFVSLGCAALAKFFMSTAGAWVSFATPVLFIFVWWKYHSSQVQHLIYRNDHRFAAAGPMVLIAPTGDDVNRLRNLVSNPNNKIQHLMFCRKIESNGKVALHIYAEASKKMTAREWREILGHSVTNLRPASDAAKLICGGEYDSSSDGQSMDNGNRNGAGLTAAYGAAPMEPADSTASSVPAGTTTSQPRPST